MNTLKRHKKGSLNQSVALDYLSYSYDSGNKLLEVEEQIDGASGFEDGTNSNDDYTYDVNGNMTSDANKGITSISYNHLNLPVQVNFDSGGVINYVYDAAGIKQRKTTSTGTATEYAGNYVYSGNTTSTTLQFFNHPEGYVNIENSNYRYVYQYKDHVGNVRLSYTDDPSNPGTPTIIEESNYYPFGLKHKGYNTGGDTALGNDLAQNWKFGGKEFDETFDINTYDFGARNYMPDIGRWGNIDPLADKFYEHSPYSYARNNPIFFVDPDGREPIPGPFTGRVIADKYGTLRAYRITTQQRYILGVESAIASAGTGLYGAAAGIINSNNSSQPEWIDRANERAGALFSGGAEGFDAFINSESMKPFRGKEVGKFASGLSKGLDALEIGMAISDTDATAQERLEEFTFAFGAALIGPAEQSSNEGILFISGSAGVAKEDFESDLNSIFLGVSLFTKDFDLTTDQGAADAANFLQENQNIVTQFIKFIQQRNRELEEQNEGQ